MPAEVIVVDNNSRDKSAAIAKSYPFVQLVREKRQGIAYARDAGFNAVKSDLIGRIDADTILPPTWVSEVLALYEKHPNIAFTGSGYFYDMHFKRALRLIHMYYYYYLNRLITGQHMLWGSNMAFPRKHWASVKDDVSVDNAIAEDMDLSFALQPFCPITFVPAITTSNSLRGGKKGLVSAWKYVRRWPLSLRRHSLLSSWLAWTVIISMAIIFCPVVLGVQIYGYIKRLFA